MTPTEYYNQTIGIKIDYDNFPKKQPYQCWDYFHHFLTALDIPVHDYCALTGYVPDLWRLRGQYGYDKFFEYIYPSQTLIDGDWVIWDRGSSHPAGHIAMYYQGQELGQNQSGPYVDLKATTWDFLGALRPKQWNYPSRGYAECFDQLLSREYVCTHYLHLRTGGDTSYPSICLMSKGDRVRCYGYYHVDGFGRKWLYVTHQNTVGFACASYLI